MDDNTPLAPFDPHPSGDYQSYQYYSSFSSQLLNGDAMNQDPSGELVDSVDKTIPPQYHNPPQPQYNEIMGSSLWNITEPASPDHIPPPYINIFQHPSTAGQFVAADAPSWAYIVIDAFLHLWVHVAIQPCGKQLMKNMIDNAHDKAYY
ncbi:hypothetical protein PAXINDRAFT_16025 [Paxillus involutus ATCC 200175]|uniref:Uncharacterized protein n=1 Tax=Paxillus involutus ATCC 200175 TaxID=664439 RepID=A0A0C9TK35_PAXIN|nr:hypothetical protein PAXINDRAFT_16025 [Paxillus involutus ATCC 200175]